MTQESTNGDMVIRWAGDSPDSRAAAAVKTSLRPIGLDRKTTKTAPTTRRTRSMAYQDSPPSSASSTKANTKPAQGIERAPPPSSAMRETPKRAQPMRREPDDPKAIQPDILHRLKSLMTMDKQPPPRETAATTLSPPMFGISTSPRFGDLGRRPAGPFESPLFGSDPITTDDDCQATLPIEVSSMEISRSCKLPTTSTPTSSCVPLPVTNRSQIPSEYGTVSARRMVPAKRNRLLMNDGEAMDIDRDLPEFGSNAINFKPTVPPTTVDFKPSIHKPTDSNKPTPPNSMDSNSTPVAISNTRKDANLITFAATTSGRPWNPPPKPVDSQPKKAKPSTDSKPKIFSFKSTANSNANSNVVVKKRPASTVLTVVKDLFDDDSLLDGLDLDALIKDAQQKKRQSNGGGGCGSSSTPFKRSKTTGDLSESEAIKSLRLAFAGNRQSNANEMAMMDDDDFFGNAGVLEEVEKLEKLASTQRSNHR